MHQSIDGADGESETLDEVVEGLQQLRADAGNVSYAEIAVRIARQRTERGASDAAARVARSTVYDAFRRGRARLSADLVGEIAEALGADEVESASWRARVRGARTIELQVLPTATTRAAEVVVAAHAAPSNRARHLPFWLAVVASSIVINLLGNIAVARFGLPLYLDMTGTAIAAMSLGPWSGVVVAVLTNLLAVPVSNPEALTFTLVNIVGALVWGYGVKSLGLARSLPRYFALNLLVALACTITAVPLILAFFGTASGHASDAITLALTRRGDWPVVAVFSSNLLNSVADKAIAGFVALAALSALTRWRAPAREAVWAYRSTRQSPSPLDSTAFERLRRDLASHRIGRVVRAADGPGLENQWAEMSRGFESHTLRSRLARLVS